NRPSTEQEVKFNTVAIVSVSLFIVTFQVYYYSCGAVSLPVQKLSHSINKPLLPIKTTCLCSLSLFLGLFISSVITENRKTPTPDRLQLKTLDINNVP
uniref:Uncharacterized protein n=1 Tax=Salarias fasciatus TaxID=181472 RepID=A0A672J653_SALFA